MVQMEHLTPPHKKIEFVSKYKAARRVRGIFSPSLSATIVNENQHAYLHTKHRSKANRGGT